MTYQKPEVLHFGSAATLIRGGKAINGELESPEAHQVPDSDLDD